MSLLKIYNSLSRTKEEFIPITPGKISMYVCGMTVYDYCHIGHARVLVAFDMIRRWFSRNHQVTYVRNITDIDDKIIERAARNQESIQELTGRFIHAMNEDAAQLLVEPPDHEPRATQHVTGMIAMITTLIQRGLAYQASNGDVYYAVAKFPGYGKLSGKSLDNLRAGERVEIDQAKRDPLDFVLWKSAKPGEPAWPSPWGLGRPGWHIECSVMAENFLGEYFDVHGGGEDLQFPHHENEIAQSEGAHQRPFVNYWIHNGFVRVDDEKMSKSLGNFFTVREVLKKYDGEVVRFFILRAHYRSPLNYSEQQLDDAKQGLTRLYTALKSQSIQSLQINWQDPYAARFSDAMNDDFNTPQAIAVLFELAAEINKIPDSYPISLLKSLAANLGLLQREPLEFLQQTPGQAIKVEWVEKLIEQRLAARAAKNFKEADRIRQELADAGIILEDSAQKTVWRRA